MLDADTREPISNVAIYNADRSKTELTDFDGKCNLTLFDRNERISFKHIAYELRKTTKSQAEKQGRRVFLLMKAEQLDEVVMSVPKKSAWWR